MLAADIPLLRSLPGFEGFDPQKEVLRCDKPGRGPANAPRAFQVKFAGVLIQKCGMRQSGVDNDLCFRHDASGTLICLMTNPVDDLKIAGEPSVVQELLKILEHEFGELTIQRGTFTDGGVQHVQNPVTGEIALDQIDFRWYNRLC